MFKLASASRPLAHAFPLMSWLRIAPPSMFGAGEWAPKTPSMSQRTLAGLSKAGQGGASPLLSYAMDHSLRELPVLAALRQHTMQHVSKPGMMSDPLQNQFMRLLIACVDAKRVLEIGVFTGYATCSMAMALPEDGQLLALECDVTHMPLAEEFWERAGVRQKIDVRLAPALDTLESLLQPKMSQEDSFDLCFVDADKANYDAYYEKCLRLCKVNGLIIIDNMLWKGRVLRDPIDPSDMSTTSIHKLNLKIHTDERVQASLLPIGDGVQILRRLY